MRRHAREVQSRVPGTSETSIQQFAEWVCPDCDYFEEADEEVESR